MCHPPGPHAPTEKVNRSTNSYAAFLLAQQWLRINQQEDHQVKRLGSVSLWDEIISRPTSYASVVAAGGGAETCPQALESIADRD